MIAGAVDNNVLRALAQYAKELDHFILGGLRITELVFSELEAEKAALEEKLSSGSLTQADLQEASSRYGALLEELDQSELRWLELSDI